MTLDQLRHFVTAAELQNLTRAADELYLSHSTISRSITALEHELGTQLLCRSSRSVTCTKAGALLKQRAANLLVEVDSIQRDVSALGACSQIILRTACGLPLSNHFLDFTERFREVHPEIIQTFYNATPIQAFEDLRNGRCDIAVSFSYAQPNGADELHRVTIDRGSFRLLTSVRGPLAHRTSVDMEEVKQFLRPSFLDGGMWGVTGDEPRQDIQKDSERNLEALFLPVQLNQASIVVPEHVCGMAGELCISIPIVGCDTTYDINVCWIKDNPNPEVSAFISVLEERFVSTELAL